MLNKKIISLGLVSVLVFSLMGCSNPLKLTKNGNDTNNKSSSSDDGSFDIMGNKDVESKIEEINDYIDYYFYFDTDAEAQEEAIYDGIMAGLDDPYSVYYTADEFQDLMEDNSGEYVGVGAVVTQGTDKLVTIVRPIPGSPAEEAGLMAEDIVVEVDGIEIIDQELSLVVDMIRGEEGTKAKVKVYRPSIEDYLEFEVTRRLVENVSVYSEIIKNDIGYVQVQQFYDNTADEFIEAMEYMQKQNVKGIVIDLRDNPGGLLDAVVEMCDYVMGEGPIVVTKDKYGNVLHSYMSTAAQSVDIPMVVLINGNSASASEILAGALKDTGKAKLVGTTTFGKGIVQSVMPLSDGTAIKLTVAKYFTPNGNDIHEIGIEPDYEVELPDGRLNAVNLDREEDTQLKKAIEVIREMK